MKTIQRTSFISLLEAPAAKRAVLGLVAAGLLSMTACTSTQQVSYAGNSSVAALNEAPSWVLVAENPPTYHPAGMDHDASTDFRHGEWVKAGDNGATWFVPHEGFDGLSASQLRRQLFAKGTDAQKRSLAVSAVGNRLGDSARAVVSVAVVGYGAVAEGKLPNEVIAEIEQQ